MDEKEQKYLIERLLIDFRDSLEKEGLILDPNAAAYLESMLVNNSYRFPETLPDPNHPDVITARNNLRKLAKNISRNRLPKENNFVSRDNIKDALLKFCPLYPIC